MADSVNGVNYSAGSTSSSAQTSASQSLGKDDFLKIFAAQLQNQDPSDASSDPEQYVQQMAQFTEIEQLTNLATAQEQAIHSSNVGLVGHTVSYYGSDGSLDSGTVSKVTFDQSADGKGDTVTLSDGTTGINVNDLVDVQ